MPSSDYQRYVANERRKRRIKLVTLEVLVSILLFVLGMAVCHLGKSFVKGKILDTVKLQPGSVGFTSWLNPPINTTRNYYLFNITNPVDIAIDPSWTTVYLKDTPPYAYDVKTKKMNVQWSNDSKVINYTVERLFTRHPTLFNSSSVDDVGIFVDMLRAIYRTQFQAKPAPTFFDLGGDNPFYHRNAVEQLEGFISSLFTTMQDKMYGPNTNKYGFVYRQNGSRLYNVSIQSGKKTF
jgi:hypothetical protein